MLAVERGSFLALVALFGLTVARTLSLNLDGLGLAVSVTFYEFLGVLKLV